MSNDNDESMSAVTGLLKLGNESSVTDKVPKWCSKCNGMDHERRSSKLCKHHIPRPKIVIIPKVINDATLARKETLRVKKCMNNQEYRVKRLRYVEDLELNITILQKKLKEEELKKELQVSDHADIEKNLKEKFADLEQKLIDSENVVEELKELVGLKDVSLICRTMTIPESSGYQTRNTVVNICKSVVNPYQNILIVLTAIETIIDMNDKNSNPNLRLQKEYIKYNFEWQPIYKKNEFVSAILSFKHNGICIPWLQVKKSDIIGANLGLFILQDLPQNFLIGVYIGNKVKKGNADVESNFAIENSKGFKMDCPKFPDLMMGMGIHMGNDLDFVVQDRICQYKLYVIKNDKLSSLLEVKKINVIRVRGIKKLIRLMCGLKITKNNLR